MCLLLQTIRGGTVWSCSACLFFFLIPLLLRFLDVCLHFNETKERKSVDLGVWGSEEDLGEAGKGKCNQNILYKKSIFKF